MLCDLAACDATLAVLFACPLGSENAWRHKHTQILKLDALILIPLQCSDGKVLDRTWGKILEQHEVKF